MVGKQLACYLNFVSQTQKGKKYPLSTYIPKMLKNILSINIAKVSGTGPQLFMGIIHYTIPHKAIYSYSPLYSPSWWNMRVTCSVCV